MLEAGSTIKSFALPGNGTGKILKKYVDKTNLITLIKVLYDCYHQKLFTNNVLNSRILKKLTIINDYLYKLQYNVNLSLLLSGLTLELGEVNE